MRYFFIFRVTDSRIPAVFIIFVKKRPFMLTFLVSLLAAVTLQVQHRQVPDLLDEDVAVAVVRMVDGADTSANEALSALSCKVCGLPSSSIIGVELFHVVLSGRNM
jgi:hypothetical protein